MRQFGLRAKGPERLSWLRPAARRGRTRQNRGRELIQYQADGGGYAEHAGWRAHAGFRTQFFADETELSSDVSKEIEPPAGDLSGAILE